jgi:hypothetical protein
VDDLNEKGTPQAGDDEIEALLANSGARAPDVSRLGEVALSMEQMEWKLLRRNAAAASCSRNGTRKQD